MAPPTSPTDLHSAWAPHGLELQGSRTVSQRGPVKPTAHVHTRPVASPVSSWQTPPLLQGFGSHAEVPHRSPTKCGGQVQVYPPSVDVASCAVGTHVPPCRQGEDAHRSRSQTWPLKPATQRHWNDSVLLGSSELASPSGTHVAPCKHGWLAQMSTSQLPPMYPGMQEQA